MQVARRFPFVVSAVVLLSAVSIALAQQDSKPAAKADAKASDGKTAKPRAKPRGRLPAYYSKVVDGQQKEKIYAIQQQYEPKITALKAELKALQEKVDAEVEGVLTPEQQAIVKKLTEEAKAKRKAAGTSTTSTTDGEAEEDEGEETEADEKAEESTSKTTGKTGK